MNIEKRIRIRNLDVLIPSRKKFRLRWKEYQILSLLVSRSPELVSRSEIIENIWKGTYCSDSTINQTIKSIRQKIGDDGHTMIRTIPRLGYKVENKEIFHFISEEDTFVPDEVWLNREMTKNNIQEELSETQNKDDDTIDEKITAENGVLHDPIVQEISGAPKKVFIANKPHGLSGFIPAPLNKVMKYLAVFASLLVISHLSYVLGNQSRLSVTSDIPHNPRLVLSLTLNSSRSSSPQALICLYHEGTEMEIRIECVDPKPTSFQEQMRYELSAVYGSSNIEFVLPNQTREYQVKYDAKS